MEHKGKKPANSRYHHRRMMDSPGPGPWEEFATPMCVGGGGGGSMFGCWREEF